MEQAQQVLICSFKPLSLVPSFTPNCNDCSRHYLQNLKLYFLKAIILKMVVI